jgi:hypothetical protein
MKSTASLAMIVAVLFINVPATYSNDAFPPKSTYIMEGYPNQVQARIDAKKEQIKKAKPIPNAFMFYYMISTKWLPGRTIKVAFRGGTPELHDFIAKAASEWVKYANISFDFGYDVNNKTNRTWSNADTSYVADIRVGFDQGGYWSVIGTDCIDPAVVPPNSTSLNLYNFDNKLPEDASGIVIHEFGHALGAEHEHQNPMNGCENEFRFDDDPGYLKKQDFYGQYINDDNGRRPGLYTWLGGFPNKWPTDMVDRNLRSIPNSSAFIIGTFDVKSVMKYYFPDWMFKNGINSPCYSPGENLILSAGDINGIRTVYPLKGSPLSSSIMQDLKTVHTQFQQDQNLSLESRKHFEKQLNELNAAQQQIK